MARTKPKERARTRFLDDQEIRDVWHALDKAKVPACYPAFVRTLLLTAQRRSDVSHMASTEIEGNAWVIPAVRYKTKKDNAVPLTKKVLQLIGSGRKGFVFSSDSGKHAFSGYSKAKNGLDRTLAELRKQDGRKPMARWSYHDLRRTARSLMSRAGVPSDHAERVLGHAIGGVRAVYDRHAYLAEKTDALEKLAALIDRIISPPAENVVAFTAKKACIAKRSRSR
jgi:integrase